jgi:hypothetical protein
LAYPFRQLAGRFRMSTEPERSSARKPSALPTFRHGSGSVSASTHWCSSAAGHF